MPAGGLVQARQGVQSWDNQPAVEWAHRDPLGVSEPGAAYDPLGNHVAVRNPAAGQPPPAGTYGPSYGGAASTFSNAQNFSTGCMLDGVPANCNSLLRAVHAGTAGIMSISSVGLVDLAGLGLIPAVTRQNPQRPTTRPSLQPPTGPRNPQPGNPNPYGFRGNPEDIWSLSWVPLGEVASNGALFITPSQPTSTIAADPCAGKKNTLSYKFPGPAINRVGVVGRHISERHISLQMNKKASKYVFMDDQGNTSLFWDQSNKAMVEKASIVAKINQETFLKGAATLTNNGRIAYVYAWPDWPGAPGEGPRLAAIGLDSEHSYDITNVSTVIVDSDCSTVITSHPGLPSAKFFSGPFNWTGTPRWIPRTDPHNPGWTLAYQ